MFEVLIISQQRRRVIFMATDLIESTVSYGHKSVTVYFTVPRDAEVLSKMLRTGSKVTIEQVFSAPDAGNEENVESVEEVVVPKKRNGATATLVKATGGVCRGKAVLPDVEHGPPGRGQAHGFCPDCIKRIPRAKRLEMYEEAKKAKESGAASQTEAE